MAEANRPAPSPGRVFVGRSRELALLRAGLDAANEGHGGLFVLVGEPGIGKTHLAEELSLEARRHDAMVCWGRCWEGDGAPAYWPWVQILREYGEDRDPQVLAREVGVGATEILRLVPELAPDRTGHGPVPRPAPAFREALNAPGAPSGSVPGLDPEVARFRLFESVASFLRRAAESRPLVLVLDDLHGSDLPSARLLLFVSRSLRGSRLLVVGTWRDVEVDRGSELGGALAEIETSAQVLRLDGLAEPEVAELLAGMTEVSPAGDVTAAIHAQSGGNPLFVRELGWLLAAPGRPAGSVALPAVPAGVRAVIERRLAHLSRPTRRLLELAAVAAPELDLEGLRGVAGLDRDRALGLLDEAVRARLIAPGSADLGRYVFAHALVREVLYEGLGLARRAELHRRLAEALEGANPGDDGAAEIAHHFRRGGDAMRAAAWAEQAGRHSVRLLAYEEAAAHFQRGLDAITGIEAHDRQQIFRLLLGLGDAYWRSGDSERARAAFVRAASEARETGDAAGLAEAALGCGRLLQYVGIAHGDPLVIRLLEEALAALPPSDGPLRTRLLTRLAQEIAYLEPSRFQMLVSEAVAMARRVGDPATLGAALETQMGVLFGSPDVAARLDLARVILLLGERSGDVERMLWGRIWRVVNLLVIGDILEAERESDAFSKLAAELRWPWYLWFPALWRAMRALLEGRFGDAEPLMVAALEAGGARGQVAADHYGIQLLALRREQGRIAEMEPLLRDAVERYPMLPAYRCALAFAYADQGREALARAELERLAVGGFAAIPRDYNWIVCLVLLAETCARLEDAERAATLYRLFLPYRGQYVFVGYAGLGCGAVTHYLGILAATAGDREEAEAQFEEALRENARLGAPPWLARARHDYARMLLSRRGAGDRERASRLLDEALTAARELGMAALAARIERELENLLQPAPAPAPENVFRSDGEYWTIAYRGAVAHLKDSKGLRDLASLLASPGREIPAIDLVSPIGPHDPADPKAPVRSGGLGDLLDARARSEYRERLRTLEEGITDAESQYDRERAARLREERDLIAAQLSAAYGLRGRGRPGGDPAERARQAVAWRIRDAIARIAGVHPDLGRHLKRSIRTGRFCSYEPESPTLWGGQAGKLA